MFGAAKSSATSGQNQSDTENCGTNRPADFVEASQSCPSAAEAARVAGAIDAAGMAWMSEAGHDGAGWADIPTEVFARAAIEAIREPTLIATLRAENDALREALKPLAEKEIPKKPLGNAGVYSLRFSEIEAAAALAKAEAPDANAK